MSQRPFDHIENKIREAAEQSDHPFNEHAWEKMELLLDKEKAKRRFFFWWRFGLPVVLVCLGVGGYFLFSHKSIAKEIATATKPLRTGEKGSSLPIVADTNTVIISLPESSKNSQRDVTNVAEKRKTAQVSSADTDNILNPTTIESRQNQNQRKISKQINSQRQTEDNDQVSAAEKGKLFKKRKAVIKSGHTLSKTVDIALGEYESLTPERQKAHDALVYGSIDVKDTFDSDAVADSLFIVHLQQQEKLEASHTKQLQSPVTVNEKKKTLKPNRSKFYFVAEGGVEILKTKVFSYNNSIVSGRYGAAIGYELNKRFNIQAGFYAGRKKYTGGPGDYHPKQGSYLSMVNLKKVDASCLIYDIPVSLRYNLAERAGIKWYVMAGVSSFIMKKEDYNYHYTYSTAPYTEHEKAYSYTGNKNLFSVVSLSAGFERAILKNASLIIEPYISLPLKGVGEGTVKLYSTGIQLGIKYSPKF